MAARKQLRAVIPGEKAKPKRPMTVAEAADRGTARDLLLALRACLAKAIDDPNIRGADLASLSRRLMELRREIDAIDVVDEQETDQMDTPDDTFDASKV